MAQSAPPQVDDSTNSKDAKTEVSNVRSHPPAIASEEKQIALTAAAVEEYEKKSAKELARGSYAWALKDAEVAFYNAVVIGDLRLIQATKDFVLKQYAAVQSQEQKEKLELTEQTIAKREREINIFCTASELVDTPTMFAGTLMKMSYAALENEDYNAAARFAQLALQQVLTEQPGDAALVFVTALQAIEIMITSIPRINPRQPMQLPHVKHLSSEINTAPEIEDYARHKLMRRIMEDAKFAEIHLDLTTLIQKTYKILRINGTYWNGFLEKLASMGISCKYTAPQRASGLQLFVVAEEGVKVEYPQDFLKIVTDSKVAAKV